MAHHNGGAVDMSHSWFHSYKYPGTSLELSVLLLCSEDIDLDDGQGLFQPACSLILATATEVLLLQKYLGRAVFLKIIWQVKVLALEANTGC